MLDVFLYTFAAIGVVSVIGSVFFLASALWISSREDRRARGE